MNKVMLIVNYYVPIPQHDGKMVEDINRGVFNFHPNNISSFNHAVGGVVIRFYDIGAVKVAMSFEAVLALYRQYGFIDDRYQDEVESFKDDNLKFLNEQFRKNDGER